MSFIEGVGSIVPPPLSRSSLTRFLIFYFFLIHTIVTINTITMIDAPRAMKKIFKGVSYIIFVVYGIGVVLMLYSMPMNGAVALSKIAIRLRVLGLRFV
jgi:hypothetical protein